MQLLGDTSWTAIDNELVKALKATGAFSRDLDVSMIVWARRHTFELNTFGIHAVRAAYVELAYSNARCHVVYRALDRGAGWALDSYTCSTHAQDRPLRHPLILDQVLDEWFILGGPSPRPQLKTLRVTSRDGAVASDEAHDGRFFLALPTAGSELPLRIELATETGVNESGVFPDSVPWPTRDEGRSMRR